MTIRALNEFPVPIFPAGAIKPLGPAVPPKPTVSGEAHYNGYVVLDFIHQLSLSFIVGNIVKYVCRYKQKGGLKDLKKARDYLDQLIEREYGA